MRSENNHIDNFFRNKNKEVTEDTSRMEADWQQMRTLMSAPMPTAMPVKHVSLVKRYLPYAAMLALVAISAVIIVKTINKRSSNLPVTVTNPSHQKPTTPTVITIDTASKELVEDGLSPNPKQVAPPTPSLAVQKQNRKTKQGNDNIAANSTRKSNKPIAQNNISDTAGIAKTNKEDAETVYNNFYASLSKTAQVFTINNQADTVIKCAEGTSLYIPANCFQTNAGLAVSAAVTIYIREFYNYADIIGNKLTTTSNGRGLETGGMLNIDASAGNESIRIRSGSSLGLKMPAPSFDYNMQLFVDGNTANKTNDANADTIAGNMGFGKGINWIDAGQRQAFWNDNRKVVKVFNLSDNPYQRTYIANENKVIGKFKIPYNCPYSTEDIKEMLEERYGKYYTRIKVKRAWRRSGFAGISITRNSSLLDETNFVGDSVEMPLHRAAKWRLISREDSLQYEKKFQADMDSAIRRQTLNTNFIKKSTEYNFTITQLGWINCDRFLGYPRSRLTDFVLNPGEGFDGNYFNAILIFEKEHSAMPGYWNEGKIIFANLPVGHSVNIVCAGIKDGKMHIAIQKATVERKEVKDLQFEALTPQEFKSKLSVFGDVKN